MPRDQPAPKRSPPPHAALLLLGIGINVALSGCGEAAKAKVELTLRTAPGNDGEIVVLIPQDSVVKVSNCSHGWCRISWHGQTGYALAKNLSVIGLTDSATDSGQDNNEDSDE